MGQQLSYLRDSPKLCLNLSILFDIILRETEKMILPYYSHGEKFIKLYHSSILKIIDLTVRKTFVLWYFLKKNS